jgi:hypothetical protein
MNLPDQTPSVDYRSSGKVNWAAFLPWAALALLVSAGLAFGMNFLFEHGQYYIGFVPILAAMICAGMVLLAVHKGHCRSAFIGLTLGLIAGAESLAGFYYAGMISNFGPEMASRLDLLPRYIALRKQTDISDDDGQEVGRGGNPVPVQMEFVRFGDRILALPKRETHKLIGNWILFGLDACILVLLPAGAGLIRARRGYCENCRRWLTMAQAVFPYGSGKDIAEMVTTGNLSALQNLATIAMPQKGAYTSLAVEYCVSDEGQTPTCPAYVSVKDVRIGGGIGQINQVEAAPGWKRLRRRLISKEEIAQLIGKLPTLSALMDKSAEPAVRAAGVNQAKHAGSPGPIGQVSKIEDPFVGKILSKRVLIIGNVFAMMILPLFFGPVLLTLAGIYLCTDEAKNDGWQGLLTDSAPLIVAVGTLLLPVGLYLGLRCPNLFGEWFLRRHAKNEIRSRPNWIVDPDDPEAIFVQIVPRCNWGRVMLETATDVGFLKVDENRREILFEGDKERYCIPGQAIISCNVEQILYGEGTAGRMTQYTTVLCAHYNTGIWENPIGQRGDFGMLGASKRLRLAEEMRDKMLSIRG